MSEWRCLTLAAVVVLAGGGVAACGGGGGASCPDPTTFQPCGGDVQGEWTLTDSCYTIEANLDDCPEALVSNHPTASGTILFRADGTYSSAFQFGGTVTVTAPLSCTDAASCTDLSSPADNRSCSGTDPCECTTQLDDTDSTDQGSYSTAGSTATLSPTLGLPRTVDYCVDGDVMAARIAGDPDVFLVFTR